MCVQEKSFRVVPRSEHFDGIASHLRGGRDFRYESPIRTAEPKLAVGLTLDLETFLVDGAVVPATQHGEVRERGGATVGPVTDVMALAEPHAAAREAAAAVAMVQRAS